MCSFQVSGSKERSSVRARQCSLIRHLLSVCSVLSPPPRAPLQSWVTCDSFAQGQAVVSWWSWDSIWGLLAAKPSLWEKREVLAGPTALSDLLKTMGTWRGACSG